MIGAALLAGRAALKMGAGCVHVGLLADNAPAVDSVQPELMLHQAVALLHPSTLSPATSGLVLAVGCGLGQRPVARDVLLAALALDVALVLDADALNLLATHDDLRTRLTARTAPTVLTPHPGEAARLLGCTTAEIQRDRPANARRLAEMLRCDLVLKGADSVCATQAGSLWCNSTGNPGMSAPGMGDVLTGMVAGFIAQGLTPFDALRLAVYLHGAAGDALAAAGGQLGMTASELTDRARLLLNFWQTDTAS